MRMRKKKNLAPRMEACGAYLIRDPFALRGRWRELMPAARAAAGRLAAAGEVEVTQHGEVVDVATARGPVRVRRPR